MLLTEKLSIVIIKVILCIAVTSTNTIVLVAWWSPRNRASVSIILCLIATYDIATIFLSTIDSATFYVAGNLLSVRGCYVTLIIGSLAFIFHSLSILTTMYLAFQRIVICLFPFSGPRICRPKTTLIFSILSCLLISSITFPLSTQNNWRNKTIGMKQYVFILQKPLHHRRIFHG